MACVAQASKKRAQAVPRSQLRKHHPKHYSENPLSLREGPDANCEGVRGALFQPEPSKLARCAPRDDPEAGSGAKHRFGSTDSRCKSMCSRTRPHCSTISTYTKGK